MNWAAVPVEVPVGVVTVTFTVPVPGGVVAVSDVPAPLTTTLVAALAPKWTAVAPVKSLPTTVIDVPPAVGPEVGLTEATEGHPPTGCKAVINEAASGVPQPEALS